MERGYVKLWRKSLDSAVFADSELWRLWCWCLMRANHKVRTVAVKTGKGNTLVTLQPGQFIFGRKAAAKALKCPPSSIRNRIDLLRRREIVDIQSATHYSVISIVNWDSYQNAEDSTRQGKRTTRGQPKDTDKNVKNVKNKKQTPRKRGSASGKVEHLNPTAVKIYNWYAEEVIDDPTERIEAIQAITTLLDEGHRPQHLSDAAWDYTNHELFPGKERYRTRAKKFFGREKGYVGFGLYPVFSRSNGEPIFNLAGKVLDLTDELIEDAHKQFGVNGDPRRDDLATTRGLADAVNRAVSIRRGGQTRPVSAAA